MRANRLFLVKPKKKSYPFNGISAEAKYPELGFTTYGMGWNQNVYRGLQRLQHNGSIEGFVRK